MLVIINCWLNKSVHLGNALEIAFAIRLPPKKNAQYMNSKQKTVQ